MHAVNELLAINVYTYPWAIILSSQAACPATTTDAFLLHWQCSSEFQKVVTTPYRSNPLRKLTLQP